jgi:acetylornithine deacetylase/succinyl-diaminopimelate desuccinylase-like protein
MYASDRDPLVVSAPTEHARTSQTDSSGGDSDVAYILLMLLSLASPTGHEHALAELIARWAEESGLSSRVDRGVGESANVVVTVPGRNADARSLLIYAPIDTVCSDKPEQYAPWFGTAAARVQWSRTRQVGDWIVGEGAENPKGYAAAALSAALTLSRDDDNAGDVHIALCGGSVPSLGGDTATMGLGSGVIRLLQRGLCADAAIACKPGWFVTHEEAGVVWLRVRLAARGAYVGSRHSIPYRNVIPVAARLAAQLEHWFEDYSVNERAGTVAPQGAVTGVHAGVAELTAFVGEACEVRVDVRVSPRRAVADVVRLVRGIVADILADEDVEWSLDSVASVPPSTTPDDSPILTAARTAWFDIEGAPPTATIANSGASDANLLRAWGIPTARIGMPLPFPPDDVPTDPFGLNAVNIGACEWFASLLSRTAITFGQIPRGGS